MPVRAARPAGGVWLQVAGFANRQLTELMGALLDASYTNRQATYDLRRLRRKGLMVRLQPVPAHATRQEGGRPLHQDLRRVLTPGLALLDPRLSSDIGQRAPLAVAWRRLDRTLDDFIASQMIAA